MKGDHTWRKVREALRRRMTRSAGVSSLLDVVLVIDQARIRTTNHSWPVSSHEVSPGIMILVERWFYSLSLGPSLLLSTDLSRIERIINGVKGSWASESIGSGDVVALIPLSLEPPLIGASLLLSTESPRVERTIDGAKGSWGSESAGTGDVFAQRRSRLNSTSVEPSAQRQYEQLREWLEIINATLMAYLAIMLWCWLSVVVNYFFCAGIVAKARFYEAWLDWTSPCETTVETS